MLSLFAKSVNQLSDPKTRGAVWVSLGIAVVVFIGLWLTVGYVIANTALFETLWLEWVVDILGGLATLLLTWMLFPGIVSAAMGFFLDRVADAVEARHYPHLPPADGLPLAEQAAATAKFLGLLVALNLLVLPFVLIPPVFPFVFLGVNGYLISREYFELVALRRVGREDAKRIRLAHRNRLFLAGVGIAVLLAIPVVNLLAPVIATAVMVHLFEGWRAAA